MSTYNDVPTGKCYPATGPLWVESAGHRWIPLANATNVEFSSSIASPTARFMGPPWGPSGADRTQMGPMLEPWNVLSGIGLKKTWHSRDVIVPSSSNFIPNRIQQYNTVCTTNITNNRMKGQSEIAYLPKFANIMLIVMVIVINAIF